MTKTAFKNEELIKLAREGDKTAEEELLLTNDKFCYHIAKKYLNPSLDIEDLASIAKIGLLKAYKTFDLNKGNKFITYAARIMSNEIFMSFRQDKKHRNTDNLEQAVARDFEGSELTLMDVIPVEEPEFGVDDYNDLQRTLEIFNNHATERQKIVLRMYYYENKKQNQIADELKLSQSYIARLLIAIKVILKNINKNGKFEKVDILKCKSGTRKKTNLDVKKEEEELKVALEQINKGNLIYIFEKFPKLSARKIAEIAELNENTVNNYKVKFKKGELSHLNPLPIEEEVEKKLKEYEDKITMKKSTPKEEVIKKFNNKKEIILNDENILIKNEIDIVSDDRLGVSNLVNGISNLIQNSPEGIIDLKVSIKVTQK